MMGTRWRIAISCARRIFLIVSGHHEPAFTVASFATTTTARPPMVLTPVTTPAAGAWPSYWSYATSSPTSSHAPSRSSNAATRSRAVSLPCSCWRRTRSGPPPCSSRAWSARYSAVRAVRRDDTRAATGAGRWELRGDMVSGPLLDVLHELGGRRPGAEQPADALALERLHVFGGDDAAARDQDLVPPRLSEQLLHPREQRHVRSGENRQADHVHVFLDRRLRDLLGGLVQARIDHFHPGVAQRGGDDLGAAVVAVEPGLRHEHPDGALEPPRDVRHQRRKRSSAASPSTARRARSSYSTSTCARWVSASSIASSIAASSSRPSTTRVRTCPRSRALSVGATPLTAQPVGTRSRTASAWVRSQTRSRSSRRLSAASRTWAAVTLFGLSLATPSTRSWR